MPYRTLVELVPLVAAVVLALWVPSLPAALFALPSRILRKLAPTGRRAILSSAVLTFAACAACSWLSPRSPTVPDEFSYLLAADTFAHGRLTNPTHPLWEHFESFQTIQKPTYQSKYPPGQALFVAAGQVLSGRPIVGVWLSMAAGAAALCWMLLAWMPPRWALFGALLPALRFGALPLWDDNWFVYWSTTFWGGAVAMLGGALFFGALPRLLRTARRRDAVLLGLGLVVLANTRPYEGLVVSLPGALVLLFWARQGWRIASRVAAPAAAVLICGFVAMAYYNLRVTEAPLTMPYQLHAEQYEVVPFFAFQEPRASKVYRHDPFRAYYEGFVLEGYRLKRAGLGFTFGYVELPLQFFWGFVLGLPVLFAFGRPFTRWAWFAAAVVVLLVLASAATSLADKLRPHYAAPVAPLMVFLAVAGLRRLRTITVRRSRIGRPLSEVIVVVALLSIVVGLAFRHVYGVPYQEAPLARDRPAIAKQLEVTPGNDLVIATYAAQHNEHEEWVYNGADLDGAPIVWARDLGPAKNRRLLEYYAGRNIWRLYADEHPPRLEPYGTTPQ